MLQEVVVDKETLAGFKARALRAFPVEYGQALWGFVEPSSDNPNWEVAHICLFGPMDVEEADGETFLAVPRDGNYGEEDNGLTLLGSIHTHPDGACSPSPEDFEAATEDGERVLGICAIRRTAKRRFVSYGFFRPDGAQLDFTIAEDEKNEKEPVVRRRNVGVLGARVGGTPPGDGSDDGHRDHK